MNRFLVFISYIIIVVIFLFIFQWQIKSTIEGNNRIIDQNIKQSVNEQLKLKYAPVIELNLNDNKARKKIILTKEQIDLINKNIAINTARVDAAIQNSNDEIARDISRVSVWVTILLAGVSFFGILVPLGINFFSTTELRRRMGTIETQIANTNTNLDTVIQGITTAISQSNIALTTSQEANHEVGKLATILLLLDTLSKMKMLDFLRYNIGQQRDRYIRSYFERLKNCFESCKNDDINPSNNPIFREACVDLNITTYQLFIYVQSNRALLQDLGHLIHLVDTLLNANPNTTDQAFQDVIDQLDAISAPVMA